MKPNLDSNVDLMALYKVYGHLFHSEFQDIEIWDPKVLQGGRDRMVVGFTTTYAISAWNWSCDNIMW